MPCAWECGWVRRGYTTFAGSSCRRGVTHLRGLDHNQVVHGGGARRHRRAKTGCAERDARVEHGAQRCDVLRVHERLHLAPRALIHVPRDPLARELQPVLVGHRGQSKSRGEGSYGWRRLSKRLRLRGYLSIWKCALQDLQRKRPTGCAKRRRRAHSPSECPALLRWPHRLVTAKCLREKMGLTKTRNESPGYGVTRFNNRISARNTGQTRGFAPDSMSLVILSKHTRRACHSERARLAAVSHSTGGSIDPAACRRTAVVTGEWLPACHSPSLTLNFPPKAVTAST
jgi:hypothetical protein